MKKTTLSLLSFLAINSLAQAVTVNAPSSLISGGLDGNKYYSWGVQISLGANQYVDTASVTYTNVKLTASGIYATDKLWTDLLNTNTASTSLVTSTDSDFPGDAWTGVYSGSNYVNLGVRDFTGQLNQNVASLTYNITGSALTSLNSFLGGSNHSFSIGIDPDCHYSLGGLAFNYTIATTPAPSVPDGGMTFGLLAIGLAGLEVFRRKLASPVAQA